MVEKLLSLPSPRPKGLFFLLEAAFLVLGGPLSPSAWPLERGALLVVRRGTRPFPLSKDRLYATLFFAPLATDGRMKEKGPNNCVSPFAGKHAPLSLQGQARDQEDQEYRGVENICASPARSRVSSIWGIGMEEDLEFSPVVFSLELPASLAMMRGD